MMASPARSQAIQPVDQSRKRVCLAVWQFSFCVQGRRGPYSWGSGRGRCPRPVSQCRCASKSHYLSKRRSGIIAKTKRLMSPYISPWLMISRRIVWLLLAMRFLVGLVIVEQTRRRPPGQGGNAKNFSKKRGRSALFFAPRPLATLSFSQLRASVGRDGFPSSRRELGLFELHIGGQTGAPAIKISPGSRARRPAHFEAMYSFHFHPPESALKSVVESVIRPCESDLELRGGVKQCQVRTKKITKTQQWCYVKLLGRIGQDGN